LRPAGSIGETSTTPEEAAEKGDTPDDDSPADDPELDYAIRTNQATFGQWASAWFFSRRKFNLSGKSRDRWARARDGGLFEAFVSAQGRVTDAYYCSDVASAAAVTLKRRSFWSKLFRWDEPVLHILNNAPEGAESDPGAGAALDLLSECSRLALRSADFLTIGPRRYCVDEVFGLTTDALFILDEAARRLMQSRRTQSSSSQSDEGKTILIENAKQRASSAAAYIDAAASRSSQFYFLRGVLAGVAIVALMGWLVGTVLPAPFPKTSFAWVLGAGALGAFVSVLLRVRSSGLTLDFEVGRSRLVLLGAIRPFFGGLSGFLLLLGILGGVIPLEQPSGETAKLALYVVAAFFAGFNERWIEDMLANVGRRIKQADSAPDSGKDGSSASR
jgi:hypothetical protein